MYLERMIYNKRLQFMDTLLISNYMCGGDCVRNMQRDAEYESETRNFG